MGCSRRKLKDGGIMIICGPGVTHSPCRECGYDSDFLCDFPVGEGKTCDANLCRDHAHEVAPGIHYCPSHFQEWKKFRESGGVRQVLQNVVPFDKKDSE